MRRHAPSTMPSTPQAGAKPGPLPGITFRQRHAPLKQGLSLALLYSMTASTSHKTAHLRPSILPPHEHRPRQGASREPGLTRATAERFSFSFESAESNHSSSIQKRLPVVRPFLVSERLSR